MLRSLGDGVPVMQTVFEVKYAGFVVDVPWWALTHACVRPRGIRFPLLSSCFVRHFAARALCKIDMQFCEAEAPLRVHG